ncbi:SDR family oxidoreductase [Phycicoccus sp. BSK3Z-2]|uniref:SDR family oxidoreductase n=1 Tax=Phycicoccus avicenniae TaxID=2828860 RepID=A0A941I0R1_9MICO|nr:SDR family oxidoreductase [Phycicoccus avicenniae]MBR7744382.1 SDR family oxidoreductase [Phycicoccus avicenniae]
MTIVVTGATGQLGHLVVEHLLRRGADPQDVVATGRDVTKAADLEQRGVRVEQADYSDAARMRAVLEGADRVLLVSGSEVGQRVPQHTTAVEAARDAGVGLLVYTSITHADSSPMQLAQEHRATEQLVRDAGLPWVFLRNGWYLENYTPQIPTYLETGAVVGAAGDGKVSGATRSDYADAAAAVLLADDVTPGTVHELGGPAFTLADLAATVADASGSQVVYRDLPPAELTSVLEGAGLPAPVASMLADSDEGIARGDLEVPTADLERLIGRRPEAMEDVVRAAVAALRAASPA